MELINNLIGIIILVDLFNIKREIVSNVDKIN